MLKRFITPALLAVACNFTFAQVFGPNNPNSQSSLSNGNLWSNPTGILQSDDTYSNVNSEGITSTLISSNYGFNLTIVDQIQGIELDIERKSNLGPDVTILNNWQDGELSEIPNFNLSAGNNRMMIVFVGTENGNEPTVNNITMGGLNMTRLDGLAFNTSFWGAIECWYMLESELSALVPGAHALEVTYTPFVNDQFFNIISGVVLQNVDQLSPFESVVTKTVNGGGASTNFNMPILAGIGGAFVTGIFCGNPSNSGNVNGITNNWSINNGFIEGTDIYRSNTTVAPTTGGCMQTAFKLGTAGGTENPVFTFNGNPNRRLLFGLGLRKATAIDNVVQLRKSTGAVGSNYANTINQWPIIDTYTTYGGPLDLWGTSWSNLDVNSPDFGAQLQANVLNGGIDVDNMRITIYTVNILPVELVDFQAQRLSERSVQCKWFTASELNTSHFELERSSDGFHFEKIAEITASGNSTELLNYDCLDNSASDKELYYRIKMVDLNGEFEYSAVRAILGGGESLINVYPNPTHDWVNVLSSESNATITITTSSGRIIDQTDGSAFDDQYKFNLSNEPDGVYYIITQSNGEQEFKRLVKTSK